MKTRFPHKCLNTSGFTLVELLVVMTIIAALTAIAFPVYAKIKERASAAACANNLSELGKGVFLFAGENDGDLIANEAGEPWPKLLQSRYVQSNGVYHSPFDRRPGNDAPGADEAPVSYGANASAVVPGAPKNVNDAAYDSSLILLAPVLATPKVFVGTFGAPAEASPTTNGSGATGGTHSSGHLINVLYLDGHVKAINMNEYHNVTGTAEQKTHRWEFQGAAPAPQG